MVPRVDSGMVPRVDSYALMAPPMQMAHNPSFSTMAAGVAQQMHVQMQPVGAAAAPAAMQRHISFDTIMAHAYRGNEADAAFGGIGQVEYGAREGAKEKSERRKETGAARQQSRPPFRARLVVVVFVPAVRDATSCPAARLQRRTDCSATRATRSATRMRRRPACRLGATPPCRRPRRSESASPTTTTPTPPPRPNCAPRPRRPSPSCWPRAYRPGNPGLRISALRCERNGSRFLQKKVSLLSPPRCDPRPRVAPNHSPVRAVVQEVGSQTTGRDATMRTSRWPERGITGRFC